MVPITRRRALEAGLAGAAVLATGRPALASPWPSRQLTAAHARRVDPRELVSPRQLHAWQAELDGLGLRATATPANERYIDVLHDRLVQAGVHEVREERVPIDRWTATAWSLELDGQRVPTASYVPYAGAVPGDPASGPLALLDDAAPAPGALAGKVALFEVPVPAIPNPAFESIAYRVYDPRGVLAPDGTSAPWQPSSATAALDRLEGSGAVAAIGILDLPPDAARGAYFPYDGTRRSVSGVYVDRPTGERLKAAAAAGTAATVTVRAEVSATSSRNLLGVIPGASRELALLNCHTDGPNGIEDNGPNAIVAIAQYLARLPRGALPRTVLVSLTTGHFHRSAGQAAFIARHLGDLIPRTAFALTVEHLGAREWLPGPQRSALTGNNVTALFFAPETSALVDAAYAAAARAKADPTLVARPITTVPGSPDGKGFPAEGTALWTAAAIPTANFITGPFYLFNWGTSTMRFFDSMLMHAQTAAFAQMFLDLSRVPRARLRALDLLTGGGA